MIQIRAIAKLSAASKAPVIFYTMPKYLCWSVAAKARRTNPDQVSCELTLPEHPDRAGPSRPGITPSYKIRVKSHEYYEENMAVSLNAAIRRSLRPCITTPNPEELPSEGVQAHCGRAENMLDREREPESHSGSVMELSIFCSPSPQKQCQLSLVRDISLCA